MCLCVNFDMMSILNILGGKPPIAPVMSYWTTTTTTATVSWTVAKVSYTPENYTLYYTPTHNFHKSSDDSINSEAFNTSDTIYMPDNQTFPAFFLKKNMNFTVEFVGLTPSTNYFCFVVAKNTNGSSMSEVFSIETKANCK